MRRVIQVLTLVVLPSAVGVLFVLAHPADSWWAVLVAATTCVAMAVRGRLPLLALALAVATQCGLLWFDGRPLGAPALLIALYTLALVAPVWQVITGGLLAIGLAGTAEVLSSPRFDSEPDLIAVGAVFLLGLATGVAVRQYRSSVVAANARAKAAELQFDEEARRRIAEDRVELSRELHDSVAHQLAVINVQTGVAKQLLTTNPDGAMQALEHVADATRGAMIDVGGVITGLRNNTPAGGLEELCAAFRATGSTVFLDANLPGNVTEKTRVLVYRIVQEGLTNARKHAPTATVTISVVRVNDNLEVRVANSPTLAPPEASSGGHGLLGLYERVHDAGGTLQAGPEAGGFVIQASLPLGAGQ